MFTYFLEHLFGYGLGPTPSTFERISNYLVAYLMTTASSWFDPSFTNICDTKAYQPQTI